jgi:citrate lyase beta subunit
MSAIHPRQLEIINDVFTPDEERVEFARKLVDGFDASEKDSLVIDGVFLDTATVDRYRDIVRRYEQIQKSQSR